MDVTARGGAQNLWMDSPQRYGLISRVLHWGMAHLLVWQFTTILLWRLGGPTDWVKAVTSFGPYHGTVGLMTVILVVIRAIWAMSNRHRRPAHGSGWLAAAARAGHMLLYGLMFAIPALALLRSYGNGKGWKLWGVQIIPETGVEIGWMIAPANALHGVLAWCLSAAIFGHVVMAFAHRLIFRDRTLATMAGPLRSVARQVG